MRQSGVIYQYIDRPANPDELILEAHREDLVLIKPSTPEPKPEAYEPMAQKAWTKGPSAFGGDRPLAEDAIVIEAHREAIIKTPHPAIAEAFSIPENIPVHILREQKRKNSIRPIDTVSASVKTVSSRLSSISLEQIRRTVEYSSRVILGIAMIGLVFLVTPYVYTEARFRVNPPEYAEEIDLSEITIVDSVIDTPTFTKLLNEKYIRKLGPVNTDYALVIPKIGVNSPVVPNVDPANKTEYQLALKQGAAHAKGTSLPDQEGSKYIFAHSTDNFWNIANYNAIFYLLKDLEPEDQIYIVYNGTLYPYKVSEKRVVNADDTYYLKPNNLDNRLILQTCWPPGTTWKRMLVFAEPIDTSLDNEDVLSYSLDK
ncbi:sortase [Candidatus Roizmanbacteria bacterium]|nr:sortase [Candidatus Roizmanbacteria bacterium]